MRCFFRGASGPVGRAADHLLSSLLACATSCLLHRAHHNYYFYSLDGTRKTPTCKFEFVYHGGRGFKSHGFLAIVVTGFHFIIVVPRNTILHFRYAVQRSRRPASLRNADASQSRGCIESIGSFRSAFPFLLLSISAVFHRMQPAGVAAQIHTVNDNCSCMST